MAYKNNAYFLQISPKGLPGTVIESYLKKEFSNREGQLRQDIQVLFPLFLSIQGISFKPVIDTLGIRVSPPLR